MHRRNLLFAVSLFFLAKGFLTGCIPYFSYFIIDIKLTEVERPVQAKGRYGEHKITEEKTGGAFEDGLLKVEARMEKPVSALFVLTNKTQYILRIDWSRAKFVGVDGRTHTVGVLPKPDDLAELHGALADGMATGVKPAGSVRFWVFPSHEPSLERLSAWEVKGIIGKTVKVLLPLHVEDERYEYVFTFQIVNVKTGI